MNKLEIHVKILEGVLEDRTFDEIKNNLQIDEKSLIEYFYSLHKAEYLSGFDDESFIEGGSGEIHLMVTFPKRILVSCGGLLYLEKICDILRKK